DTLADLLDFASRARARIGELTAPGAGRDALIARAAELQETERTLAETLSSGRARAAEAMTEATGAELSGLAMPGASLLVQPPPRCPRPPARQGRLRG